MSSSIKVQSGMTMENKDSELDLPVICPFYNEEQIIGEAVSLLLKKLSELDLNWGRNSCFGSEPERLPMFRRGRAGGDRKSWMELLQLERRPVWFNQSYQHHDRQHQGSDS